MWHKQKYTGKPKRQTFQGHYVGTREYSIEHMSNGLTRVFSYASQTSGLFDTATGKYHSGDLRAANWQKFIPYTR